MDFVWFDQHNVAGSQAVPLIALIDNAFSFEHKHLMLIGMAVPRSIAAGRDFELAHRKIWRAILFTQEPANTAALRAFHFDRLLSNGFVVMDLHGSFSPCAGRASAASSLPSACLPSAPARKI